MPTPPIIIKKKSGHGGHHGGAWKVAYADFVTAMMALFIVLWLMSSSSKQEKAAISGYFKDPSGTADKSGTTLTGAGENIQLVQDDMSKLKQKLQESIQKMIDLDKLQKNIEMTLTPEGLRIELLESQKGTFFENGHAALNQKGQQVLTLLAAELGKVPNKISIEGHTDARPYIGKSGYSNWDLSSDRANAARRLMQQPGGLRADQVSQVRGFADQRPLDNKDPMDPANRRISIVVQYINRIPDLVENQASGGKKTEETKASATGEKMDSETPEKVGSKK
jgi:chemotaxis protein MotB